MCCPAHGNSPVRLIGIRRVKEEWQTNYYILNKPFKQKLIFCFWSWDFAHCYTFSCSYLFIVRKSPIYQSYTITRNICNAMHHCTGFLLIIIKLFSTKYSTNFILHPVMRYRAPILKFIQCVWMFKAMIIKTSKYCPNHRTICSIFKRWDKMLIP